MIWLFFLQVMPIVSSKLLPASSFCTISSKVISPSFLTTMSSSGHSWSAFSSQKVTWEPPIMVKHSGQTSFAIPTTFNADLYVRVVDVTPTMVGWRFSISLFASS